MTFDSSKIQKAQQGQPVSWPWGGMGNCPPPQFCQKAVLEIPSKSHNKSLVSFVQQIICLDLYINAEELWVMH